MNTPAYHAGKKARRAGRDRACEDGRSTPATRSQFYAGWDDEDRARAPKLTAEQRAKVLAGWNKVKEAL